MKRQLILGATMVGCLLLALCGSARAQAAADYGVLMKEYSKPEAQRDWNVVDQKIDSIVANRGTLNGFAFTEVKKWKIEREMQKLGDKRTAEDVKRITQESLALIEEIGKECLGPDETDFSRRNNAYIRQLLVVRLIPDLATSREARDGIIQSVCKEIDELYLKSPRLSDGERVSRTLRRIEVFWPLPTEEELAASDQVYEMVLVLDTPESRQVYLHRADLKARLGLAAEAIKDYDAALTDAKSPVGLKQVAHLRRMQALMGLQRWQDAKVDAEELAKLTVTDAKGVSGAMHAAQGRLDAARVRMALGEWKWEDFEKEGDAVILETLNANGLGAEDKSAVATATLIMLSREATSACIWEKALGFARSAYNIAPNENVPGTVTLIQQLLANRSHGTLKGGGFSVAPYPQDVACAEAFFARQSGQKKSGDKTVSLRPDLSNDGEFPRQLDKTVVPFNPDLATALGKMAAEHPDLLTRALAQGILQKPDAALDTMAQAVGAAGLSSAHISEYANFAARFVRAKLESVALANAFLNNQAHGSAGPDGKMGTDDDTPNPLMAPAKAQ